MQNVAQNRDVPAFELPFAIANRQRVEQSLRGMFVRAVARIHHRNFQPLGHEFRRARRAVPDHDSIGTHRFERANRIDQRFALFQARRLGLQRHGVRAEARCGGGEADARARGGFEERERDSFAAQRGKFF